MNAKRERFAGYLRESRIIVAPGVCDCIGASLVEDTGYEAVYITGFGTAASLIGKPDLGFLSLNEALYQAGRIDTATSLPVVADAEAGFGNALSTMRTVSEYEKIGITAIHIEDQINPKRWKPDGTPQVVAMEEHADKIRAAVQARKDPNFLIIGRTDAVQRHGLAEAIRRANAYLEAGADLHFIHGIGNSDDLEQVAREIEAPGVVNYSTILESGNKPVPISKLENMGYKLVIFPTELLLSVSKTMKDFLIHLKKNGSVEGWQEMLMSITEFKKLFKWSDYCDLEKKWLPDNEEIEQL